MISAVVQPYIAMNISVITGTQLVIYDDEFTVLKSANTYHTKDITKVLRFPNVIYSHASATRILLKISI